jgi:hypothetical protein
MGSDNLWWSLEFAASFSFFFLFFLSSFTCAWLPSLSPHMSRTHHNHKHNRLLSSHFVCASPWQKLISWHTWQVHIGSLLINFNKKESMGSFSLKTKIYNWF